MPPFSFPLTFRKATHCYVGEFPKSFQHQQVPPSPGAEEPWPLQPQVYSQRCLAERVLGLSVHNSPLLLLSQAAQSTVQIKITQTSKSTSSRELWPLKPPGSAGQDDRDGLITVQHQCPMGTFACHWLHPCSAGHLLFLGSGHPGRGLLPSKHMSEESSTAGWARQLC